MNERKKKSIPWEVSFWITFKTFELSSPFSSSFKKKSQKIFTFIDKHYLYIPTHENLPKKQSFNSSSIILKDESLTIHCFHHNPFRSVLVWLPKVENNYLHEIFTTIFTQLIFHFPLEMILPYLHGFFHFLREINLLSPLWLFNFLHR
jgi:hypothetical protein